MKGYVDDIETGDASRTRISAASSIPASICSWC